MLDCLKRLRSILLENEIYGGFLGANFNDPCEAFYSCDLSWSEEHARLLFRYMKLYPPSPDSMERIIDAIVSTGEISREEAKGALEALPDPLSRLACRHCRIIEVSIPFAICSI
jgi:hypothetical protein